MLEARAAWRGAGQGQWTLGAMYMQTCWKCSVKWCNWQGIHSWNQVSGNLLLWGFSFHLLGVLVTLGTTSLVCFIGLYRSFTWNNCYQDGLENLVTPSAFFVWHIRAPVVVAGSRGILNGRWFGRTQCRFVCIAFPMLVEDMALPAFPTSLRLKWQPLFWEGNGQDRQILKATLIRCKALVYEALLISPVREVGWMSWCCFFWRLTHNPLTLWLVRLWNLLP